MRKELIGPLLGIGFIVVLVISFLVMGDEPPEADEGGQAVIDHYVENKDSIQASAVIGVVAALLLVFFANYLRRVFAEAGEVTLSATVLVGAAIVATAAAIDGTISFALAEAAEDLDPAAAQAVQAIWDNDWLPFALGILIFLFSAGIATLKSGVLPAWLGWAAIVLAVVGLTPIGFAAFLGAAIWILVVSGLLLARANRGTEPPAVAPPPPAAP